MKEAKARCPKCDMLPVYEQDDGSLVCPSCSHIFIESCKHYFVRNIYENTERPDV